MHSISVLEPVLTGYNSWGNNEVIQKSTTLIQICYKRNRLEDKGNFMKMTIALDYSILIDIRLPANGFDLAVMDRKTLWWNSSNEIMDVEIWRNEEYQSKPALYVRGSDGGHRSIVREEIVLKILVYTKVLV